MQTNIYKDDIESIKPKRWITDNVIEFYMEYLQVNLFANTKYKFISPSTSYILAHEEDQTDFIDTLNGCDITDETELVLMPLNNNMNVTKVGGSHWILLVYDVKSKIIYIYDSLNERHISKTVSKLATKLDSKTILVDTVQQFNNYDCGVHILFTAQLVARLHEVNKMDILSKYITDTNITKMRNDIAKLMS